jgi:DNA adenine methylase
MTKTTSNQVLPIAPYLGGKRNLARRLVERINKIDHITYAEPFVGMGGVFLRRDTPARSEVVNDINKDIFNLFRQIQEHESYFLDYLSNQLTMREEFARLVKVPPETLTDLQRAARFLYLQRTCFGGNPKWNSFGVSPERGGRFNIAILNEMIRRLHKRMAGVVIECLPYDELITRYDRPSTLFYLDPPYYGCENDYGNNIFSRTDFQKIGEQLASIKGQFIMSINDTAEIREVFDMFDMEEVRLNYSVAKKGSTQAKELIISN